MHGKVLKSVFTTILGLFIFVGHVGAASYNFNPPGLTPETSDLWDVSNSATVTGFSDSYYGTIDQIKQMFGATGYGPESEHALFQ